jgi:hypothetical protein
MAVTEDTIQITISAPSSSNTLVLTSPAVKNQIVVSHNDITSDERAKLLGIETGADVTDATNVLASGAVMTTGNQTIAGGKTFTDLVYASGSALVQGGLTVLTGTTSVGVINASAPSVFTSATFSDSILVGEIKFLQNGTSIIRPILSSEGALVPDDLEIRSNGNITLALDYDDNETSQSFIVKDGAGAELFKASEGGLIKVNNAYTFPTADGSANEVLTTNGAGLVTFQPTSQLALGTTSTTALAGDTTTISASQASAITANTAKVSYTDSAVDARISAASIDDLSDVTTPTNIEGDVLSYQSGAFKRDTFLQALKDISTKTSTGLQWSATSSNQTSVNLTQASPGIVDLEVYNDGTDGSVTPASIVALRATHRTAGATGYSADAPIVLIGRTAATRTDTVFEVDGGSRFDGELAVAGNIMVTGTVDGIDVATDVAANTIKVGFTNALADARIAAANIADLSDVPAIGTAGQVLAVNSGATALEYVAQSGGGGGDVVDDTTPQLGGDLASNGSDILFADNDKAIFGAGSDLQIYHSGSDSFIHDAGSGDLKIQGSTIKISDHDGSPTHMTISNGSMSLNSGNGLVNVGSAKVGNGTDEEYIKFDNTANTVSLHIEDAAYLTVGDNHTGTTGYVDIAGALTVTDGTDDLFKVNSNGMLKQAGGIPLNVTMITSTANYGSADQRFFPIGSAESPNSTITGWGDYESHFCAPYNGKLLKIICQFSLTDPGSTVVGFHKASIASSLSTTASATSTVAPSWTSPFTTPTVFDFTDEATDFDAGEVLAFSFDSTNTSYYVSATFVFAVDPSNNY